MRLIALNYPRIRKMESFWNDYGLTLAASFAFSMGAVLLLWLISIVVRDASIIDMFFPVIMAGITGISYLLGDGSPVRKSLVVMLVGVWALRLSYHLIKRNWGHGEDPRYSKLRSWVETDRQFNWLTLRQVFLLQGVVIWLVSIPVQIALTYPKPDTLGWPAIFGTALWALGFIFEWVSDAQLTKFRANPQMKGTVLNTGLWKYSRHPNYFGELCVWWGLFLIACDNPVGLLTVVGPLAYTYLIINVTGQRTLEKKLARERPGYQEYMDRTSGIIPMKPRTGAT